MEYKGNMNNKEAVRRTDAHNVDHYIKHLEANGLVPRKQGFGIPKSVSGDTNVLGANARKEGLPHIVSQICLSDVFRTRELSSDSDHSKE